MGVMPWLLPRIQGIVMILMYLRMNSSRTWSSTKEIVAARMRQYN